MWQLSLGGGGSNKSAYPERPGEPECNYYMRTGRCDFGDKCRFNHPRNRVVNVLPFTKPFHPFDNVCNFSSY
ncbi:unnamed protein product [Spirodela intermedia]|uniref:C3H1-type domain-containing protein n=1 Tax=Spirodela intermedia TaxID=51605 RepID=A0A7I8J002_SPIIN|nr:unnamed protein product [Spirodela intermedia]CAA6663457.1 unnamed protein product [Spirodela intermedia]